MSKRLAYAYRVLGFEAVEPPRKLSRCERRTSETLLRLGPPSEMTTPELALLNTIAGVCRSCGACPDMQRLSVMEPRP